MSQSYVHRLNIHYDEVDSVSFFDAEGGRHEMSADVFVIACSPIESARLCLHSGLGNDNPNIGHNLMFHYQTLAAGLFFPPNNSGFPGRLHPHRGRTATYMFDDFAGPAHVRDYADFHQPRGGTVELGGGQHLIDEAKLYFSGEISNLFPPGTTPKDLMRGSPLREHLATLTMQGEDLPQLSNKVELDRNLKDVFGVPSPCITYQNHDYERYASSFYSWKMEEVLRATGVPEMQVLFAGPAIARTGGVPATGHILGMLWMGKDPDTSVTGPTGRVHGVKNLYVADGSLFPTSGGMNPALTIMALGYRVGCSIINPKHPLAVALAIDRKLLQ
jgi:choline dehydrogenase-like flavoprotein